MKFITALAFCLASAAAFGAVTMEPGTYTIDSAHSIVSFEVDYLGFSPVTGRFNNFSGELVVNEKLPQSTVTATIETTSVDTGNEKRDDHLRTADFFDTKKYPQMTFKSKKVTGTLDNLTVVGDLTLHGVTKEVTLKGKALGTRKGMMGETRSGFALTTTINRKDFGLKWNKLVEATPVVGDQVRITLNVQVTKAEQPGNKS